MKLTIFNCSPKLGKNNTEVMVNQFATGFQSQAGNQVEVYKLNQMGSVTEAVEIFAKADNVLVALPLYYFAMPGGVKEFIEGLEPLAGECAGKRVAFLIQYGFQEAIHARPLEAYFVKLAQILNCDYLGTIIKGGCDGLSSGTGFNYKKILAGIYRIGETLGKNQKFDQSELDHFAQPELQQKKAAFLVKLILKLINKYYWGGKMKKNGLSIAESFARPYAPNSECN
ncbi:MAG TPA: NAD(P)H-dependent oxidoreductase [Bacillota bacterium]|nr:NAD(P)H-dependent oxidoreductase [Bacillota bacterium]